MNAPARAMTLPAGVRTELRARALAAAVAGSLLLAAGCAPRQELLTMDRLAQAGPAPIAGSAAPGGQLPELRAGSPLADYILYASLSNPGLQAAFHRWTAALDRVPQARALPDPQLSYSVFVRREQVNPTRQEFVLSQTFPWFGKRGLAARAASEAANAERQRFEAARLALRDEVQAAWHECRYLGRAIEVVEGNVQLLRRLEAALRTRFAAGLAPHGDLIKLQVELDELEDRLRSLQDLRAPLAARLDAALNRKGPGPFPEAPEIPGEPIAATAEQLLAMLRESSPELKALDAEIAKEQASVERAKKDFYPDVMLGLDYMDMADPGMRDPAAAMITLSLPIWRGKYAAGVREARSMHLAALAERRDQENALAARLQVALYGFRDADRKIGLYRETLIPRASQALAVKQQEFEGGKAPLIDVIDAERTLLEFHLSLERARADHAQRRSEVERLVGRELSGGTAPLIEQAP